MIDHTNDENQKCCAPKNPEASSGTPKADSSQLSVDELEAVSGGADRNWVTEGCAATVEYGSWCGSNDRCVVRDVTYSFEPTSHLCPNCGKHMYLQNTIQHGCEYEEQHRCKFCGCIVSETDEYGRSTIR